MEFQLRPATRKSVPIKIALTGVSGSGKSMGALLTAKGLSNGNMEKVAVIDTEQSICLYSHMGNFQVLNLKAPFSPERYIAAIEVCEKSGIEIIVLDSISHQWNYLLQLHASLQGNSFTNWNRITPLYNAFVQRILQSPCHIIATIRSKTDYVIKTENNKTTVEKVGTKAIQRSEIEYEFSTVFSVSSEHKAKAVKDRTQLFENKGEFIITENTGKELLEWSDSGLKVDDVKQQIKQTSTLEQLTSLYNQYPEWYKFLSSDFIQQKKLLQLQQKQPINNINNQNTINYGNLTNQTR